eukprot:TRINITY_DN42109_c0_g1_i1.p1 TRINITY_DN42109_c0_g1~~TRINITY_DN42109_c0_g1_i1.p1  ORF type:complete len:215 (-),score=23.55 TRINITY_DN42109_c0_g1_i1:57-701(-)
MLSRSTHCRCRPRARLRHGLLRVVVLTCAGIVACIYGRNFCCRSIGGSSLHSISMSTFARKGSSPRSQHSSNPFSNMRSKAVARRAQLQSEEESDNLQLFAGVGGLVAGLIMLYSEYTLGTTGCGLPAGPFGLLGLAEGLSYLAVIALVGFSLKTKADSGSGLPAGPNGVLGAAEGLAYLAALAGVVALIFQIVNYGFIPEPVPVEGGRCSNIY